MSTEQLTDIERVEIQKWCITPPIDSTHKSNNPFNIDLEAEAAQEATNSVNKKKDDNSDDEEEIGTISKIRLFFENTYLRDALAVNDFDERIYIRNVVPWRHGANRIFNQKCSQEQINILFDKELDFAGIRQEIQDNKKLIGYADKLSIEEAITLHANMTHFDSVIEELELLPKWDGVERVGHMLNWFLGAEDSPYVREVETKFFNALVMRQYHPGCKFDHIIVLVGPEDLGKSLFVRNLAFNQEYFTDAPFELNKRDELGRTLRGNIVIEIPELDSIKNLTPIKVKSFLTRQDDEFRKLFIDDVFKHPRRYVLFGTTNDETFLNSLTGNRRFLVITCGMCEPKYKPVEGVYIETATGKEVPDEEIAEIFKQAWAETLEKYKKSNGKLPLVLPKSVKDEAKEAQEDAMVDISRIDDIEVWLKKREEYFPDELICAKQIAWEVYKYKEKNIEIPNRVITEIKNIMKTYFPEWHYSRNRLTVKGYGPQRNYRLVEKKEEK